MTQQKAPYPAPNFDLTGTSGTRHSLADHKGKWLVLYFYPQDDTPGCTIEACSIRDARDDITALGADVLAVSRDDASSHEKFKEKYSLNFALATDPEHEVMDAYGAWGKKMFGVEGVLRKTFLIDPRGVVRKVYGRVTPLGHGEQIIEELKRLQAEDDS